MARFTIQFTDAAAYERALNALQEDCAALGVAQPKVTQDAAEKTISTEYSYMELYALFSGRGFGKEVGLQHIAPSEEGLARMCEGKPFTITRDMDMALEYQERARHADELFATCSPRRSAGKKLLREEDSLFEKTEGETLIIGEWHAHRSPREYLVKHMQDMADQGKPLVLEHIFTRWQPEIDSWLKAPEQQLPADIMEVIRFFDRSFDKDSRAMGGKGVDVGLEQLLYAAKEAGVRVIGFEDDVSLLSPRLAEGHPHRVHENPYFIQRMALMNAAVQSAIEREAPESAPVVFVGAAHAVEQLDRPQGIEENRIPGLAEILGGKSAIIFDSLDQYPGLPKEAKRGFLEVVRAADMSIAYRGEVERENGLLPRDVTAVEGRHSRQAETSADARGTRLSGNR